jgi:hypothetical protein
MFLSFLLLSISIETITSIKTFQVVYFMDVSAETDVGVMSGKDQKRPESNQLQVCKTLM